jgi:hypothetical protein
MIKRRRLDNFLIPLRPAIPGRKESDGSRNFRYKKTRSASYNAAREEKGVVPTIAIRKSGFA